MLTLARQQPQAIVPRTEFQIRPATDADTKFIDELQRVHSKMVGWFPLQQIESYIKHNQVLIAHTSAERLGYCIARDQYFKRDDCGIIYQLNIAPGKQRHLVGASLVKATFERAAYGCKLFCCWCAQDIEANQFWESMGFVPLAFRSGSRKKERIHIFWQRRIREGDMETPYWFPAQTTGGAIREDRLVLPIPPGTHWSDAKPMVLPGMGGPGAEKAKAELAGPRKREKKKASPAIERPAHVPIGGLWFAPRPEKGTPEAKQPEKPKREKTPKEKNDPKFIAAARELRDRYLEQVNADRMLPAAHGKYDVSRQLEAAPSTLKQTPLLKAA